MNVSGNPCFHSYDKKSVSEIKLCDSVIHVTKIIRMRPFKAYFFPSVIPIVRLKVGHKSNIHISRK